MRMSMLALALLAAGTEAAAAEAPADASIYGVWWSRHKNVKVETAPCGSELCGTVVWATPDALQTARNEGTDPLLGLQLLKHYRQSQPGKWQGEVFVPGLHGTFSSRLEQVAADKLKIGGCILGGLICKYQVWTRVHGDSGKVAMLEQVDRSGRR